VYFKVESPKADLSSQEALKRKVSEYLHRAEKSNLKVVFHWDDSDIRSVHVSPVQGAPGEFLIQTDGLPTFGRVNDVFRLVCEAATPASTKTTEPQEQQVPVKVKNMIAEAAMEQIQRHPLAHTLHRTKDKNVGQGRVSFELITPPVRHRIAVTRWREGGQECVSIVEFKDHGKLHSHFDEDSEVFTGTREDADIFMKSRYGVPFA
jgi:hypothetical protein